MESIQKALEQLTDGSLGNILFWNHSIIIANLIYNKLTQDEDKEKEPPLLVGFLLMLVIGLGGAISTRFLLGKRQIFFEEDLILGAFFVSWVLVLYSPFGIFRFITGNFITQIFTNFFQGFFTASAVYGMVNQIMKDYPHSVLAPIILGGLVGCGGGILFPYAFAVYKGNSKFTSELENPSMYTIGPFLCSLFYYFSKITDMKPITLFDGKLSLTPEMIISLVLSSVFINGLISFKLSTMSSKPKKEVKNTTNEPEVEKKVTKTKKK